MNAHGYERELSVMRLDYLSRPWQAFGGIPDAPDQEREHIARDQLNYLDRCLADVPYLAADLEIAATKQDRFPSRPTPITDGTESPLPYREGAARAADRLWLAVLSVATMIWHHGTHGQPAPFRSSRDAAAWLRTNLPALARDPDAEQYARRIADAHDQALAGPVERPPDWTYLGPCPACNEDLEALSGQDRVTCDCGWTEDVRTVIAQALEAAQDMLFTDTQLVGALELDGKIVSRDQIKGWHRRGRLQAHDVKRWAPRAGSGATPKIVTVRTFRLSEVRELVARMEARRSSTE